MSLTPGARLGPYEVVGTLGAGGMGEVFRATDTHLKRQVAIKVLPDPVAADSERIARFQREAEVLAALNHPNIAAIYGLEKSSGVTALVMELVEGQTLDELIASRQPHGLPLDEALAIARQIADALEAAHDRGIVHRDLKPANVKVRDDGTVKVLDFGLAKAAGADDGTSGVSLANSPTLTSPPRTGMGMILGTAAYMAPEQARGRAVDKRADIWAFGCLLYEMTTGRPLFAGDDVTEIISSVVKDVPDLSRAPLPIRRLLERCLEKDPKNRLRNISVAWELVGNRPDAPSSVAAVRSRVSWLPWAVASLCFAAAALFAGLWWRTPVPEARAVRFEVAPPPESAFTNLYAATGISPDGRYLVFGAGEPSAATLWLRQLDSGHARLLPGTEGSNLPFWSPDSRSIGFFQGGKLKRVEVAGGASQVICDATVVPGSHGTWSADGTVLFAAGDGIFRVAAAGGVPELVTKHDPARKETAPSFGAPQFLPDGRRFLFFVPSADPSVQGLYVGSLDDPALRKRILATEHKALYVSPRGPDPGALLWLREQTLLAQPFDADSLTLTGEAVSVAEDVAVGVVAPRAAFWASDHGSLIFRTGAAQEEGSLVWRDRTGRRLGEAAPVARHGSFRLSPDGTRVVISRADVSNNRDIWTLDLSRSVSTRVTFDPSTENIPVWSPDGSQVGFDSDRSGIRDLYRIGSGGAGQAEQLTSSSNAKRVVDWSPDGRFLLYIETDPLNAGDILALPLEPPRTPLVVVRTPFAETSAAFSPDGRWIAYASGSTGRQEVYVRPFPPDGTDPWQVSNQGGTRPRWRADGRELYFLGFSNNQQQPVMAVAVNVRPPRFESDPPVELFRVPTVSNSLASPYDLTADGQRFLFNEAVNSTAPTPLNVITDWRATLKR